MPDIRTRASKLLNSLPPRFEAAEKTKNHTQLYLLIRARELLLAVVHGDEFLQYAATLASMDEELAPQESALKQDIAQSTSLFYLAHWYCELAESVGD